jgi:hypothetical protein
MKISDPPPVRIADCDKPDLVLWAASPRWEVAEAAALTLGLDPRRMSSGYDLPNLPGRYRSLQGLYLGRVQLLNRARAAREVHKAPADIIRWLRDREVYVEPALTDAVAKYSLIPDWKAQHDAQALRAAELEAKLAELRSGVQSAQEPLDGRARITFQKLILSMAMKAYDYVPGGNNGPVVKRIVNDMLSLGLDLTTETARNHLRDAEEVLRHTGAPTTRRGT